MESAGWEKTIIFFWYYENDKYGRPEYYIIDGKIPVILLDNIETILKPALCEQY